MATRTAAVRQFLLGHYFHTGLRQAFGSLLPPVVLIGLFQQPVIGVAAAFGALCVAIVDQPGPQRHRLPAMLGSALLGTLTALLTGIATSWPWLLLLVVIGQTFLFGLFSAFGRRGGMMGFACLLLMTLTMHRDVAPDVAAWHALATLGGGLWYVAFSSVVNQLQQAQQEQQSLAVALFATANYVGAKADFYDPKRPLDDSYQQLVPHQAALAEKQQGARDMILAFLPHAVARRDSRRIRLGNLFIDMIDLQETMLATYTDYAELRRTLADNDFLLFGRDALRKLAADLDRIGMALVESRRPERTTGIKAEVRAMEYETVLLRRRGFDVAEPEAWVVVIQVLRRLRTAARLLARMQEHTQTATPITAALMRSANSLGRFFSREDISWRRLRSHLSMNSPHLRYAIRLTVAVAAGLSLGWIFSQLAQQFDSTLGEHSYWIVLTILVIMKPGFVLSGQRNRWRLAGTLIGCSLVLVLMQFTQEPWILLTAMFAAAVMSNSLLQLNYLASSVFNTMLVLIGFHFLAPGSLMLIGERAIDAVIGSILVWLCSWILPSWERNAIGALASQAVLANRRFLAISRKPPPDHPALVPEVRNDVAWRLARRDVYTAFGNFADAFYRMMREPASRRLEVPPLNDLLVQNHMLAAQTSTLSTLLPVLGPSADQPPALRELLDNLEQQLVAAEHWLAHVSADRRAHLTVSNPPPRLGVDCLPRIAKALETTLPPGEPTDDPAAARFEIGHLTYELRQMIRTVERIGDDARALAEAGAPAAGQDIDTPASPTAAAGASG